jgi:hypothetical protein
MCEGKDHTCRIEIAYILRRDLSDDDIMER